MFHVVPMTTESLFDDEARYRQMFEEHAAVKLLIDPSSSTIVDANPAACAYYGYSREQLTAMRISDINMLSPEEIGQEMARAATREHNYFVFPHRLASGEIRTVEVHSGPITVGGKRLLYSIIHDITERTQAEAALQKRTEQLRLLHEAGQQLSQSLDLNLISETLYRVVSSVMDCDILILSEYNSRENIIHCVHMRYEGEIKDASELPPVPLNPDGRGTQSVAIRTGQSLLLNDYLAHLRTSANVYYYDGKTAMKTEVEAVETDDTITRSALIVPLKLEKEVTGVIQVFSYHLNAFSEDDLWFLESLASYVAIASKNAALYRHVQEELAERRRAEEKFRIIFDESPEVILIINADGIIQRANRAVNKLLGYAEAALVGQHFSLLLPGGEATAANWRQRVSDASARSGTFDFLCKDGTTRPMDWAATFILWEDGQVILATLADATERRLLEAERLSAEMLRLQIQQERELIELREQFISAISHEFRTPLAIIQSSSELMERYHDRLSVERRGEHLREVQKQVRHMAEMIDDFLKLSKARAGRTKFHPEPMDVNNFCRTIVSRVQHAVGGTHRLQFTCDGNYNNVRLDEKLLLPILTNLLTNAVKYSPHGGDIRLHLSSKDHDLVFQISDQGIGIPEADQARLFEPFHRGGNVKRIEGTGLGLAVVKNSVLLHDGSIELQSKEGEGTTFTVRLPRS